jgi:hypothetical protein
LWLLPRLLPEVWQKRKEKKKGGRTVMVCPPVV